MKQTVLLGFEVGTGKAVEIPTTGHMIVTGQTQLSGKTTTLEAIIQRSKVRALVFRTKRGEGSFEGSGNVRTHPMRPYFRERTDWQFVEAILESTMRQRMKFERAWIVKACRGAKTLTDVRKNLHDLQAKSKRSMDADIFMLLGEYLDQVIPVLKKLPPAQSIHFQPGLNVVDLEPYPVEVQALVIAAMLEWVHEREEGVVSVVPESWKFLPQGRNSPVLMSAVSLAREGAGIGNRLWIDSQDIAGTEKEILRGASVWLLGVQREANELKRTLAHIPAGIQKPRAEAIATLHRGQFFACWDRYAIKTYVMPAWANEGDAMQAAKDGGELVPLVIEGSKRAAISMNFEPPKKAAPEAPEEDEMNPKQEHKLDQLLEAQEQISERQHQVLAALDKYNRAKPPKDVTGPAATSAGPSASVDVDDLYREVRARLMKEAPALLKVLAMKPELEVNIERVTISVDGKTLKGRLALLLTQGWFKDAKTGNATLNELNRRGFSTAKPNVYRELDGLAELGFLTKEGDGVGYLEVPGMKAYVVGKG